jgi:hypothetical protein
MLDLWDPMLNVPSELHLLQYQQKALEYLQHFSRRRVTPFRSDPLKKFSSPYHMDGYADNYISDDLITDLYLEFSERTRRDESEKYLRTLTGKLTMELMLAEIHIASSEIFINR